MSTLSCITVMSQNSLKRIASVLIMRFHKTIQIQRFGCIDPMYWVFLFFFECTCQSEIVSDESSRLEVTSWFEVISRHVCPHISHIAVPPFRPRNVVTKLCATRMMSRKSEASRSIDLWSTRSYLESTCKTNLCWCSYSSLCFVSSTRTTALTA